jgi:hypothetical protein
MRYRRRTLLIVLAFALPLLALIGWCVQMYLKRPAPIPNDLRAISIQVIHDEIARRKSAGEDQPTEPRFEPPTLNDP